MTNQQSDLDRQPAESARHQVASRKPYQAPQLSCYGDVGVITQAVGNMGNMDGGQGPMSMTQV